MAFDLDSGAGCRCVLHNLSNLTWLNRSWGQVWPESGPKKLALLMNMCGFVFDRGSPGLPKNHCGIYLTTQDPGTERHSKQDDGSFLIHGARGLWGAEPGGPLNKIIS